MVRISPGSEILRGSGFGGSGRNRSRVLRLRDHRRRALSATVRMTWADGQPGTKEEVTGEGELGGGTIGVRAAHRRRNRGGVAGDLGGGGEGQAAPASVDWPRERPPFPGPPVRLI